MRRMIVFLFVILLLFFLAGCAGQRPVENSPEPSSEPQRPNEGHIWTDEELDDWAYAYYQANSEHLTAFANAFSETGESQLHIRIYCEDDFYSTASTLPEQLQQPFVDCFSDSALSEYYGIEIDFYHVESFLEHPEFDPKTGFPMEYFECNCDDPTFEKERDLSGLTGVVGEILIDKGNPRAAQSAELYFYYGRIRMTLLNCLVMIML